MELLEKAKKLAKHTEQLATTPHWGVDDQDTLEWLIAEVEKWQQEFHARCDVQLDEFRKVGMREGVEEVIWFITEKLFDPETADKISEHFIGEGI